MAGTTNCPLVLKVKSVEPLVMVGVAILEPTATLLPPRLSPLNTVSRIGLLESGRSMVPLLTVYKTGIVVVGLLRALPLLSLVALVEPVTLILPLAGAVGKVAVQLIELPVGKLTGSVIAVPAGSN